MLAVSRGTCNIDLIFVGCRLKELLRKRLKECGWRDQLKEQCKGEAVLCCEVHGQVSMWDEQ